MLGSVVAGRWRIVRFLGRGGQAEVWEVENEVTGGRRALKILHGLDAKARQRLLREARSQAKLEDHPNILRIDEWLEFAAGPDDVRVALLMERAEGSLAARSDLPREELLRLFREAAVGVAAIHAQGLIHRDLKAENVMLVTGVDGRLHAKVADFGLARMMDGSDRLTKHGAMVGTPAFMAPEAMAGRPGQPADLYALGVMLYEICTGRLPYEPPAEGWNAESLANALRERRSGSHPPVRSLAPDLDPMLASTIEACLSPDPERRPTDVGALLASLDGPGPTESLVASSGSTVSFDETPAVSAPPEAPPARRTGTSWLAVIGVPAALLLTAGGAGALALVGVLVGAWVRGEPTEAAAPEPEPVPDATEPEPMPETPEPQPVAEPEPAPTPAPAPDPVPRPPPAPTGPGVVRILYEDPKGQKPKLCAAGSTVPGGREIERGLEWTVGDGSYTACLVGVPKSDPFTVGPGARISLVCARSEAGKALWCRPAS
ncbi:MAG: serine/threonine protein kinase [Alphaproteobacteria bacterium]|nr:serine/threonine protein kinase [Alphaproteobacteria bacterium]